MDTEPNLPNRPNGELPSQDGQEQQHSSTSPPTSPAAPEVTSQGQKQPRRRSSGVTALIVVLVVLLAGGSGLIYYITIYQPNVQHAQATTTALAQSTTIANANATSTDQALAIVTSIGNANDTATATAPTPIVENTSGVPCDKSFPAGANPSTVSEPCPRAQYTIHLGSSDENPPNVTVDNCTQTNDLSLPTQFVSATGQSQTRYLDTRYFDCNGNPGTLVTLWNPICGKLYVTEFPQKTTNATVETNLLCP